MRFNYRPGRRGGKEKKVQAAAGTEGPTTTSSKISQFCIGKREKGDRPALVEPSNTRLFPFEERGKKGGISFCNRGEKKSRPCRRIRGDYHHESGPGIFGKKRRLFLSKEGE